MKTKEEIIKSAVWSGDDISNGDVLYEYQWVTTNDCLSAMQAYADQETAKLRSDIDYLRDETQRLRDLNHNLKDQLAEK